MLIDSTRSYYHHLLTQEFEKKLIPLFSTEVFCWDIRQIFRIEHVCVDSVEVVPRFPVTSLSVKVNKDKNSSVVDYYTTIQFIENIV